MLINNKAAKWQITVQCEKLRQTIQEGTNDEEFLTVACEMLHSAVESATIQVSRDENTNKDFEVISARMIGLVDEYKFKFDNFSWKYRTLLG